MAFSGGLDSTFLLNVVHNTLKDNMTAVTFNSPIFPREENIFTLEFCKKNGINHNIINIDILGNTEFVSNKIDRCYTCKRILFENCLKLGEKLGITTVCEGSVLDDYDDYRPGMKAIKELGVKSPLIEARLLKEDIRFLSKDMGLSTWDKPSMACLASRFPYNMKINEKQLKMVEEAELFIMKLGFSCVRVRLHDDIARIEVSPEDITKITAPDLREEIDNKLSQLGFTYITLDLKGYHTGSMNLTII